MHSEHLVQTRRLLLNIIIVQLLEGAVVCKTAYKDFVVSAVLLFSERERLFFFTEVIVLFGGNYRATKGGPSALVSYVRP